MNTKQLSLFLPTDPPIIGESLFSVPSAPSKSPLIDIDIPPDTEVNFNREDYDTQEDWLDDSINQFFYEEGEYSCMVATFFED